MDFPFELSFFFSRKEIFPESCDIGFPGVKCKHRKSINITILIYLIKIQIISNIVRLLFDF